LKATSRWTVGWRDFAAGSRDDLVVFGHSHIPCRQSTRISGSSTPPHPTNGANLIAPSASSKIEYGHLTRAEIAEYWLSVRHKDGNASGAYSVGVTTRG
jgi:hypothetical protein